MPIPDTVKYWVVVFESYRGLLKWNGRTLSMVKIPKVKNDEYATAMNLNKLYSESAS